MRVVLQAGHCHRKAGATGTGGEQEYNLAVCQEAQRRLKLLGHAVDISLADDYVPTADAFVAVHGDGSIHPAARGCSFGYRTDLPSASASKRAGEVFLRTYQRLGYPGGVRPTNGTPGLARYYGCGRAGGSKIPLAIVVEGGFLTNAADRVWMSSRTGRAACAQAIVAAVTGREADPPQEASDMPAPADVWNHALGPLPAHMAPAGNRVFDTWAWVGEMLTLVKKMQTDIDELKARVPPKGQ